MQASLHRAYGPTVHHEWKDGLTVVDAIIRSEVGNLDRLAFPCQLAVNSAHLVSVVH